MLPFLVQLNRGEPVPEQVLAAVREAMATGQLRDGDAFPSERQLAQELRISPSAARTVVERLREGGFLARQHGSGLIVRRIGPSGEAGELSTVADPGPGVGNAAVLAFLADPEHAAPVARIDGLEIRRLIARGGMGLVFEAFDAGLRRSVAVKVLAPAIAASPEARARFLREARAAAAVDHENVLPIHAVGEVGGVPYLVMPLVRGESLQARLDRVGPLPVREILRIGLRTARGLAAAHHRGLVHRDIKPDNVLLESGDEGRVWLADFGLARAVEDRSLTASGIVAGTPQFVSPEQAAGGDLDHRTDLFSLGAVLYTAATGTPPFAADSVVAILRRIADEPAVPPRRLRPDLPEALDALILDLLAKEPGERPADADTVAARLEAIGRSGVP